MKLQWKMRGFTEILTDPAVARMIDDKADEIAEKCGKHRGFDWKSRDDFRHRAIVYTGHPRAMVVNARDNSLLKALGGV